MDPLTHTLVGAALADATPLGRRTPLAATTLMLAANLPDVDGVSYFAGTDLSLLCRRGWTHGVLALALLPLLLAGAILLADRFRRRARDPAAPPAIAREIVLLCYVGTLSHPLFDWFNTYGVRVLAPFDWRWLYGDTLFIVDPWLWLLLGGAAFLLHSRSRRARAGWAVLALLASVVVAGGPPAPRLALVLWFAGLGVLIFLRSRPRDTRARLGRALPAVALLYVVVMFAGGVLARHDVGERLASGEIIGEDAGAGGDVVDYMVGPIARRPLYHDVLIELEDRYRFGVYDWFSRPRLRLLDLELPKPSGARYAAARRAPCVRGMDAWLRYPWIETMPGDDGSAVVYLMDARYARAPTTGFGGARVRLTPDLEPVCD